MRDALQHLDGIGEDFEHLRRLMQEAMQEDIDPGVREQLADLHDALGTCFGHIKETLPAAQAELHSECAALQAAAERLQREHDELVKQVETMGAAPPPGPPVSPAYDPRHGKRLRDELVERFGPRHAGTGVRTGTQEGDVAELSSGAFQSMADAPPVVQAPPPAKPKAADKPRPPAKPKPKAFPEDSGEWTRDA
ncbi:MAG: hypothetical protein AB7K24_34615 [Gemmataceae bacterium]